MTKRVTMGLLALAAAAVFTMSAASQPPEGRDKDKGPRGGQRGGPGGPGRFELGRLLPPFMKDELKLTADQEKQLADLEKDVKERLTKILTPEQRKQLETMRPPRGPGGPGGPGGDRGGPGGERGRRPGGRDGDNPPPPPPPPPPDGNS